MDVDAMSMEQLKAAVRQLEQDKVQQQERINVLEAQVAGAPVGNPGPRVEAPTPISLPDSAFAADDPLDSTNLESSQRQMVEDMYAQGTITEEEYDEMVQRMDREREVENANRRQKSSWQGVLDIWNDKGCKKGMQAIEKNWTTTHPNEAFSAESVAKLFRKRSGEPPEFLDMKEVGEFLAVRRSWARYATRTSIPSSSPTRHSSTGSGFFCPRSACQVNPC